jgi:hypothetical protein
MSDLNDCIVSCAIYFIRVIYIFDKMEGQIIQFSLSSFSFFQKKKNKMSDLNDCWVAEHLCHRIINTLFDKDSIGFFFFFFVCVCLI